MIIYKTLDEIKKIKKANEIIARLFEDVLPKHVVVNVQHMIFVISGAKVQNYK